MDTPDKTAIAVLIPCFNEEVTIGKVINDFRHAIPYAAIYVFDNNSTDNTARIAREHGAIVLHEKRQGKGYVVQSMLKKIDADYYIMVDGDDTYSAAHVWELLLPVVNDHADMTVGNRLQVYEHNAFRFLHVAGNGLVRTVVNRLFGASLQDIMSGYRAFNRDVVQGITVLAKGFEVETEMTLQCLNRGLVIKEVEVPYRGRPPGSFSKLRTVSDGLLVLKAILIIFRDYKPLWFFSTLAALLFGVGIVAGGIVVREFLETQYITHVPLALLSVGAVLASLLTFGTGLLLDSMKNRFEEIYSSIRKVRSVRSPETRDDMFSAARPTLSMHAAGQNVTRSAAA